LFKEGLHDPLGCQTARRNGGGAGSSPRSGKLISDWKPKEDNIPVRAPSVSSPCHVPHRNTNPSPLRDSSVIVLRVECHDELLAFYNSILKNFSMVARDAKVALSSTILKNYVHHHSCSQQLMGART
jgi:hypothetical protein